MHVSAHRRYISVHYVSMSPTHYKFSVHNDSKVDYIKVPKTEVYYSLLPLNLKNCTIITTYAEFYTNEYNKYENYHWSQDALAMAMSPAPTSWIAEYNHCDQNKEFKLTTRHFKSVLCVAIK